MAIRATVRATAAFLLMRVGKPAQFLLRLGYSFPSFRRFIFLGLCLVLVLSLLGQGAQGKPSTSLLTSSLATSLASSPSPVATPAAPTGSLEELQQQQRKIEAERSNIDEEQERIQQREKSAQQELGTLQRDIKATSTEISQNEKQLQQATQRLKRLEQELTQAEKVYNTQQTATVARLRFLQRQRGSYGWAVLLQSQDLNDFLDRRYQLRQVYEADRAILVKLKANADAIAQKHEAVESQKNEIALLTQQLLAQKLDFQQEAKAQKDLINRLRLDRQALEAAEGQLARDSDNIAILIQQRLGVSNPSVTWRPGKGLLSYPCDGALTSGFGYRMHPILGYSRFHGGLDFGADYGTPIRAASRGKVLFAGWYGGYGQTVILDHGNNVTTLYGHADELYVSEGQVIQRGEPIAAVGSTGLSTGPHLHFEVRLGGEPVDPMEYL